jgi:presenilin-like A22 family membrane protease
MKHNTKITIILIIMFFITQLIGLAVIQFYNNPDNPLPFGMEPPQELKSEQQGIDTLYKNILPAFVFAILLFFILTKLNAEKFIRAWFFLVTIIALGITFNAIFLKSNLLLYTSYIAITIALIIAYFKIYKRNLIVHNFTELLIYPGIAAVFVPILNVLGIIILLLVISIYDIWAVWRSEFMQKMADYQINKIKIFTGFFIPYADKKTKLKIKNLKQKYTNEKELEKKFKKSKIKVNLAILGGGDIIFPIITAGVFLKTYPTIFPALTITIASTLALTYLLISAQKGKFYPAMPFITIGIYLGMIFSWLVF